MVGETPLHHFSRLGEGEDEGHLSTRSLIQWTSIKHLPCVRLRGTAMNKIKDILVREAEKK